MRTESARDCFSIHRRWPGSFAQRLGSFGSGWLSTRHLTQVQVGLLLGLSRIESEDFVSQHVDLYDYDPADLHREAQFLANFSRANEPPLSRSS